MKKFQGEKVRELRKSQDLRIRQLAKRARVSPTYISKVERNKVTPSIPTLEVIAAALGVSPSYFFEESIEHNVQVDQGTIDFEHLLQQIFDTPHVMFDGLSMAELTQEDKEDLVAMICAIMRAKKDKRERRKKKSLLGKRVADDAPRPYTAV